jgi:anti-sigma factor RsiW
MNCEEAQGFITAMVDREVDPAKRSTLEAHLKDCSSCRLAFEEELTVKQKIRRSGQRMHAPGLLRSRIRSDRRIFPEKSRSRHQWLAYLWPEFPNFRTALAITLLVLLILPTYYWWNRISQPVALAALETYELLARGQLPVQTAQNSDEIVRGLTRAVEGHFHPMGYDLSAMNLRPVAGVVREINGRKILVAIYQGEGGTLLCYTFLGSEADAPLNAAKFLDVEMNMNFYAFSRGGINAILHREGGVICILASEMPMDKLLALVKSKARPS